jgi:hypothetical protein
MRVLFLITGIIAVWGAAPGQAQLLARNRLAQIDHTFVCPESLPNDAAREAAIRLFTEQVAAMNPRVTIRQIVSYRVALLRRHGCRQTLANLDLARAAGRSRVGAVHLTVPLSNSRPARTDADWVQLIPADVDPPGNEPCDRPVLRQTVPSLDGGFVYQRVCPWVTSDDIIQVRLSDGRRREVTPGNTLAVIRNGPWRGYLLVSKHKYRLGTGGGSYDAFWVVRPDGREMFAIPGTDDGDAVQVREWLRSNGWSAS